MLFLFYMSDHHIIIKKIKKLNHLYIHYNIGIHYSQIIIFHFLVREKVQNLYYKRNQIKKQQNNDTHKYYID